MTSWLLVWVSKHQANSGLNGRTFEPLHTQIWTQIKLIMIANDFYLNLSVLFGLQGSQQLFLLVSPVKLPTITSSCLQYILVCPSWCIRIERNIYSNTYFQVKVLNCWWDVWDPYSFGPLFCCRDVWLFKFNSLIWPRYKVVPQSHVRDTQDFQN